MELIFFYVEEVLKSDEKIRVIVDVFKDVFNFLYLGRGYNFLVVLEGVLKLKEIFYIYVEGYFVVEMKYGFIVLIDEYMLVVVIVVNSNYYEKVVSNIEEIKVWKGKIIVVVIEGDIMVKELVDFIMEVFKIIEILSFFVIIILF